MKNKEKTIYNLKLHEIVNLTDGHTNIMRVPGGWIYTGIHEILNDSNGDDHITISKCFVPFDEEFSKQKPIELSKPNKEIKT